MCLFVSTGLNSSAFCLSTTSGSCHKMTNIKCACCHSNVKCNCAEAPTIPDTHIQSALSLNQVADIKTFCMKVTPYSDSIIFGDTTYNKIYSKQLLVINKNLERLRTVILLI